MTTNYIYKRIDEGQVAPKVGYVAGSLCKYRKGNHLVPSDLFTFESKYK